MGLVRRQYTVANSESCRAKQEIFGKYIVGDSTLTTNVRGDSTLTTNVRGNLH